MKKNITIGLPKSFLYYQKNILWKNFFKNLKCNIIVSPNTNDYIKELKEIINTKDIDEFEKTYLSHIFFLINKCTYVLIPIEKNNFETIIKRIFPNIKTLTYKASENTLIEFFNFIKLGFKIRKNIYSIIKSYIKAKLKENNYNKVAKKNQENILYNNNKKILIISNNHNIYEKYIDDISYQYIKDKNIDIIYPHILNKKIAKSYTKKIKCNKINRYLIGSILYFKNTIEAIIVINENEIKKFLENEFTNINYLIINVKDYKDEEKTQNNIKKFIEKIIKEN